MLTPDPTATPAPASDVRPRRDRTNPVVLTADMIWGFEESTENLHQNNTSIQISTHSSVSLPQLGLPPACIIRTTAQISRYMGSERPCTDYKSSTLILSDSLPVRRYSINTNSNPRSNRPPRCSRDSSSIWDRFSDSLSGDTWELWSISRNKEGRDQRIACRSRRLNCARPRGETQGSAGRLEFGKLCVFAWNLWRIAASLANRPIELDISPPLARM